MRECRSAARASLQLGAVTRAQAHERRSRPSRTGDSHPALPASRMRRWRRRGHATAATSPPQLPGRACSTGSGRRSTTSSSTSSWRCVARPVGVCDSLPLAHPRPPHPQSTVISGIFQKWWDLGLILLVVILNILIGVVQEGKAEAAADALNSMLAARAMVVRNGMQTSIEAEEVVVGDVLYLQAGDAIAADIRFFQVANLKVKESALTGESEDIEKTLALCARTASLGDQRNRGFAGTACTSGQGTGVVVAIGSAAQIGTIKAMLEGAKVSVTPLQHSLEVFGRTLSVAVILVGIAAFFIAWRARSIDLAESFGIAVGIAVAVVPEGLPSVVTIILAIGVRKMAQRNAIIRQLPAVETLGSVSVVCSDKTGAGSLAGAACERLLEPALCCLAPSPARRHAHLQRDDGDPHPHGDHAVHCWCVV